MFRFRKKKGGDADAGSAGDAEIAPDDPTLLREGGTPVDHDPGMPITDAGEGAAAEARHERLAVRVCAAPGIRVEYEYE